MSIKSSYTLTISLFAISTLSGTVLSSTASATDTNTSQDNVTVSVPVSCTMNGTGMTSHNANIPNGTYQADIGTTTLKSFCNDNQGFAIYAIGYTNEEYGNTTLIGATGGQTIVTGTASTTGSPDVSNWAVKLATDSTATYPITLDNSFGAYSSVPSSYAKVAHRDSGTDLGSSATGASLTTTYAAYISKTQQADTYNGKVKYTLVHPADHAAPIICNSNATTISEAVCLQDFAHVSETNRNSIIASMAPEQQYTLKDSRDGKTYTIAKYQVGDPGNYDVWMTQNLDLDLEVGITYTNEDTDIGYNTTTSSYDIAAWTPIRSTYPATSTHIRQWCEGGIRDLNDDHCRYNNTPESYDPGNLYWNATEGDFSDWDAYYASCDFSSSLPVCDQTKNPISTFVSTASSIPQYHLGNYYNWAAALASNDSSIYSNNDPVEQSICPAGWTLPRFGVDDSFSALWGKYGFNRYPKEGDNKLWASPLYFAPTGTFDSMLYSLGDFGGFWSSATTSFYAEPEHNAISAYYYVADSSYPAYPTGRNVGRSVRCIARPVVTSIIVSD